MRSGGSHLLRDWLSAELRVMELDSPQDMDKQGTPGSADDLLLY